MAEYPEYNQAIGPPPGFNPYIGPPPTYEQATTQHTFKLSYLDFHPALLEEEGIFSKPKYEKFAAIVAKANEFLFKHPELRVILCESLEIKYSLGTNRLDSDRSMFFESANHPTTYARVLRVWVGPSETNIPVQIGYINVLPDVLEEGGLLSNPKYDSFGNCIQKLNGNFMTNPLQGRILNVETQDMKFSEWSETADPEKSIWTESGKHSIYFLNVVRIFYEVGPIVREDIGCADFIPGIVQPSAGIFGEPQYEPLSAVMAKAHAWVLQQDGVRFTNMQSIDYKLKTKWTSFDTELDTQRSLFRQTGSGRTYYVRIVRVYYAKPVDDTIPRLPPPVITYRTFAPCQLTKPGMLDTPKFETMSQTMQRAIAWINVTGVTPISAETVTIRMFSGNQYGNTEVTYTWNNGHQNEYHLSVLRVYFHGTYVEPPASALPPVPQIQIESDCCNVM